ncbi:MAG TPA: RDD family protein [Nevskiaceae bacterium]|nr:RDD family protein [Nevskiaceae bacterium]
MSEPLSNSLPLLQPAPPWRRLAAAVYDGLLLIALWMMAALLDVLVRDLLGLARHPSLFQVYLFSVGLLFFSAFWVHGGQTLGLRAWRLRVQRLDGSALRWPVAAVRYAVMLLGWGLALAPLLLQAPRLAALPAAGTLSAVGLSATLASLLLIALDPRRRAPCDWLSGTELVLLPPASR